MALSFKSHFLMAMDHMEDSRFSGALIFVCHHDKDGAMGLVVNRPSKMSFQELCQNLENQAAKEAAQGMNNGLAGASAMSIGGFSPESKNAMIRAFAAMPEAQRIIHKKSPTVVVYDGGPVHPERGFVLHRPLGAWMGSSQVLAGVGLTHSRDIVASLRYQGEPQEAMVMLGYAGWSAEQLEKEVMANAWLTVPAHEAILFEVPAEERLSAAMSLLGITVEGSQFISKAGHA